MSLKKRLVYPATFGLLLLVSSHAWAQSGQPGQDRTTQALLAEVRSLRLALERASLNGYRAQIALERLRLQQQRVDRLTRELEEAKNELNEMEMNRPKMEEMVEEMVKEVDEGRAHEMQSKMFKAEVERQKQREDRVRQREVDLAKQLQVEQDKLRDLNDRLDLLEREMEAAGANDKR
jgi:hypothetical protein